jgi:hypothetical protein
MAIVDEAGLCSRSSCDTSEYCISELEQKQEAERPLRPGMVKARAASRSAGFDALPNLGSASRPPHNSIHCAWQGAQTQEQPHK